MFDEYNDILTVPELAEALRIGSTQTYRLLQQKKISGFKEGKDWKIPKTALIDYIQKMSHNS
ncbi:MAG: helix-turn-helix domain-containing protein [Lachnospiraceae bacterium]|nr:helix-turn-helix domain-containing protein [Lachnospiraceae bacterium]MDD6617551.1 helix-turn-helix domain-containing protein [Clostridiales bacterium]